MTEVDFWCILASDKTASEMDTNFEQAWPIINAMSVFRRFSTRYFVAKFSYGIGVLGTPQCPPKASLVWWISGINYTYLHSQLFWKIIIIIMCNNNNNNCKQSNVWKLIADFLKRNFIFSCWVRSCLEWVSELFFFPFQSSRLVYSCIDFFLSKWRRLQAATSAKKMSLQLTTRLILT